jgi:hypothetical protein
MNKKLLLALAAVGGFLCIAVIGVIAFVFVIATQNNLVGKWKADKESSAYTQGTLIEFTSDKLKLTTQFVAPEQNLKVDVSIEASYSISKKENDNYFIQTKDIKVNATTDNKEMKELLESSLKDSFAKDAEKLMQYNVTNGGKTLVEKGVDGSEDLTYTKI